MHIILYVVEKAKIGRLKLSSYPRSKNSYRKENMDLPWTLNTEEDANVRSSIASQHNSDQVHAKTVGVSSGTCLDT